MKREALLIFLFSLVVLLFALAALYPSISQVKTF